MDQNEESKQNELKGAFKLFEEDYKIKKIKEISSGPLGLVNEVEYNNVNFVAKLVKKNKEDKETDYIKEFRGPGIVKFNHSLDKIMGKNEKNEKNEKNKIINEYNLILMEKADLRNLHKLNYALRTENLLSLIYKNPFELIGDNLLRFFVKQIIQGLEVLNKSNLCHFDIKPSNILVFFNVYIKLTDFGFLRNPDKIKEIKDNKEKIRIPGGTVGYFSPEYYQNKNYIDLEDSVKQDYFALGSTIFALKFGKPMLEYKEYENQYLTSDLIIDLLQRSINLIQSNKLSDKDFIDFLCNLIKYNPKERPNFEQIYRNKWLNKNREELIAIYEINKLDEKKLLKELDKSDFLLDKRDYINKNRLKKDNNNKLRQHKFSFKYGNRIYK